MTDTTPPGEKRCMSDKILGAAIFGAGWVAGEHAKAYQACPRTRLVAVGSRKGKRKGTSCSVSTL